jgi:hypothetical protein
MPRAAASCTRLAPSDGGVATTTPCTGPRDGGQIGVGTHPFELRGVWVHGDGLIPALLEPAKDGVGGRTARARDARDDDSLPGEEIGDGCWNGLHVVTP